MSAHFSLFQSFPHLFHSVGAPSPDPNHTISLNQIHSASIVTVNPKSANNQSADGMITNQAGAYLAIYTADCVPVFLFDPQNNAIGLIHAGWQGIDKSIHTKAISELTKTYGSHPKDIIVGLGPGICRQCYAFSTPPQQADQPRWRPYVHKQENLWYVDLKSLITAELITAGIREEKIENMDICTYENQKFPSHRRTRATGEPEGRIISIIGMKSQ